VAEVEGVRVPLIEESEATGRTAELYDQIRKATNFPFVPDMFRLASTKPALLETIIAGYSGTFLNESELPRDIKELIAAWTSRVNQCPYCVGTHNFFLQAFGGPVELADAIASSNSADDLPVDDRTKALVRLVTKVSTSAYKITDEDWDAATAAGWTTGEVFEGVFTAALFNFICRLVDSTGLGTSVSQSRISQQPVTETGSAA
jgi:uncharacterized peroxidase-related enzyme